MLNSRLHFHHHVGYLLYQTLKVLGSIHFITRKFSSLDNLKVVYITLIHSKLGYASVVWNNRTLADSNELENIQRKFENLYCNRFIQPYSFGNCESVLNYLHFKMLYSRWQNLHALFLINVFSNKLDCCSIMDMVSMDPLSKLETFPHLRSIIFQDLVFQQSASQLQTTFANLWTFSVNVTSPLRVHFSLLNPTEICHYHVNCIILMCSIKF
jgi:hypothetical protein